MRNGNVVEIFNGYFAHDVQTDDGYSGCMILDKYRQDTVVGIHTGSFKYKISNCGLSFSVETLQKLNELVPKSKNM
jgi:hypothetical protein